MRKLQLVYIYRTDEATSVNLLRWPIAHRSNHGMGVYHPEPRVFSNASIIISSESSVLIYAITDTSRHADSSLDTRQGGNEGKSTLTGVQPAGQNPGMWLHLANSWISPSPLTRRHLSFERDGTGAAADNQTSHVFIIGWKTGTVPPSWLLWTV